MKFKTFKNNQPDKLDQEINDWLATISQVISTNTFYHPDGIYVVTFLYEPKKAIKGGIVRVGGI